MVEFQSLSEFGGRRPVSQLRTVRQRGSILPSSGFYSIHVFTELAEAHPRWGRPSAQSMDSNVHLNQKLPHRHTQNNV